MTQAPPRAVPCAPLELQSLRKFIVWRYALNEKGEKTKPPYNARTGFQGSSTDKGIWLPYKEVREACASGGYDGIGFCVCEDDPYTLVDLDKCISPDSQGRYGVHGTLTPYARYVVDMVDSYFEVTPSGKGLRGIVRANLARNLGSDKKGDGANLLELKSFGGYCTITGIHWPGSPETIETRQTEIELLYQESKERRHAATQQARPQREPAASIVRSSAGDTPYGLQALSDECAAMASTPDGSRNTQLNLVAFRLGQLVGGGELTEGTVTRELLAAAQRSGLGEQESEKTFQSGFSNGVNNPRSAPPREALQEALQNETQPVEPPEEVPADLAQAQKIIAAQREIIRTYQQDKAWRDALFAHPELTPIQKLLLLKRREHEQREKPTVINGRPLYCLNMAPIAAEIGVSASSVSRQVERLAENEIIEIEREHDHVRKDGTIIPLLVWGRTDPIVETPEQITFSTPNGAGGSRPRCECGGELKVKQHVIIAQEVVTCSSCDQVKVYPVRKVGKRMPPTLQNETQPVEPSEQVPPESAVPALQNETLAITPMEEVPADEEIPALQNETQPSELVEEAPALQIAMESYHVEYANCNADSEPLEEIAPDIDVQAPAPAEILALVDTLRPPLPLHDCQMRPCSNEGKPTYWIWYKEDRDWICFHCLSPAPAVKPDVRFIILKEHLYKHNITEVNWPENAPYASAGRVPTATALKRVYSLISSIDAPAYLDTIRRILDDLEGQAREVIEI